MAKKSKNDTKSKIVSAAWQLFYKQGFENTTIDEIIDEAHASKGSFYYYFDSKSELLDTLSYMFDEKYEELMGELDERLDPIQKLIFLNRELFFMIDNTVPVPILKQLFTSQLLSTSGSLLEPERIYYKVLRKIALEGQEAGLWRASFTVSDITKAYALYERGLMYDWCICNGSYSLANYSSQMMPLFLEGLKRG